MKWDSQKQQWAIAAAVVVVVALGGWWFFTGAPVQEVSEETESTTETSTSATVTTASDRPTVGANTGETVAVEDQPAGSSVRVVEAQLSRVSWVAVRDDMRIYGAARVNPPEGGGTVTDISVPLLRNTEAGKTYMVVVYADDGDNMFDFKKDALVTGLQDTFTTSSAN